MIRSKIQSILGVFKRALLKPQVFFVIFASLFGLILVFLTPPMQAPDEQTHFFQSYAISNLDFVLEPYESEGKRRHGFEVPKSIADSAYAFRIESAGNPQAEFDIDLNKYITQPLDVSNTQYVDGSSYAPIVYGPQATGIALGKVFNASPLALIWLGRLFNLAAWVIIIYSSIRLLPVAKWGAAILMLNPMAVFLSASLSSDVLNVALVVLFFSFVVSVIMSNQQVDKKKMVMILILLVILSLTKPVNILFGLLLFAIPWKKFKSKRNYIVFCLSAVFLVFSFSAAWGAMTSGAVQDMVQIQRPEMGVSPPEQLQYVLTNPFTYTVSVIKNYVLSLPAYSGNAVFASLFGTFGWLDTFLPFWVIILYICIVSIVLLYQCGRDGYLMRYQKIIFGAVFLLLCAGNITAMYFVYSPVGSDVISGVQGRYFIPALILLLGLFTAKKKIIQIKETKLVFILAVTLFIVLAMTILKIYMRYY